MTRVLPILAASTLGANAHPTWTCPHGRDAVIGLSPEAAVVYATAGPPTQDERIRHLVTGPFDWSRFLWIALRERAVSVAWRRFQRMDLRVPGEAGAQLQRHTMVADFTAGRLEARLEETLQALHAVGVEPVLLKGTALVRALSQSFRDRPMGDIDLLVKRDEAARTLAAVRALEWEIVPEFARVDYERHHHLPPMADRTGAGQLEIHTALFVADHPFGTLSDAVYQQSRPAPECYGRVPDDAHLMLHVCLHLAWSHAMGFGAWRAFYDLSRFVQQERLDWARVIDEAKVYRASSCCYWTLRLAGDLAGVAVPPDVIRACRPPGSRWLHRRLARHFEAQLDGPDRDCPSVAVRRALWRLAIRPAWSGHGDHYPWEADTPFLEVEDVAEFGRASPGPRSKVANLAPTMRYLASLAFPRDTP